MQLDKTRITIRERSYFDILDLALRVTRVHAWVLVPALVVGALPMMVLNSWLLADFGEVHFELGFPAQHMVLMTLLIVLEIPLATAPATLCLGQVLFAERPQTGTIFKHFWESLPQLLVYQVVFRPFYLGWPYLNEVILLERNPMRQDGDSATSSVGRSRILHRGQGGDLLARWFGSVAVGTALLLSIWASLFVLTGVLTGQWEWDVPVTTFYFPLALWIVVGYFSVVRFLCYLDLRIRREGWEVELLMRAEQARLTRQLT